MKRTHESDELHLTAEPTWAAFRATWSSERPPRIVLHGGYGKLNLGDDSILEVLLDNIRRDWPAAEVTVLSHGPAWVRATHGVEAHGFVNLGALRAMARADLYIIGGGGIMNRVNTYSGFRRLRILDPKGKYLFLAAMLAKACGARVSFYCVSTTSVPDMVTGWLARMAIQRADWVTVRGPLSVQVLRRLGVRRPLPITRDPAHNIVAAKAERVREILAEEGVDVARPLVVLNFRYVVEPHIDNAATIEEVARLVERLAEHYHASVLFVPFSRHPRSVVEDDVHFAREVQARLRCQSDLVILSRPYTPAEIKGILSLASTCVAERHHAVLFAASAGAPVVGVIYDDKVEQYMDLAGLPLRISLREFEAEAALRAIDKIEPGLVRRSLRGVDG